MSFSLLEVRSPRGIARRFACLTLVPAAALYLCLQPAHALERADTAVMADRGPFTGVENATGPNVSMASLTPEEQGDLDMAHKHFQAAIADYHLAPLDSAGVWNKIGIANQQMFILTEAQKSYETSLKLNPRNADVINNLATIYYSQKQYAHAENLYRKAIKISPKSAVFYKNLGTAYLAENRVKKGWECFHSALAIDPKIFEADSHYHVGDPTPSAHLGAMNYYLAKSYLQAGMTQRAIDYLRLALDEGYADRRRVLNDKEFAGLYDVPAFQQLLSERR
jgi:tetratricopeptide (TPR) repeat protein